jgi:hypothetical protein
VGIALQFSWLHLDATIFMTLKIERTGTRIRLSGEFRSDHVDEVKTEIELCESLPVLDLEELDLIDVEAVHFLNACEAKDISLMHCAAYIRLWMVREQSRPESATGKRKKRTGS